MTTLRDDLIGILRRSPRCQTYYLKNVLRSEPTGEDKHTQRFVTSQNVLAELRRMERDGIVKNVSTCRETVWSLASA